VLFGSQLLATLSTVLSTVFCLRRADERLLLAVLLRLDGSCPNHLAPFLSFVGDQLVEVGGRAGKCGGAQLGKPRLNLGIGERPQGGLFYWVRLAAAQCPFGVKSGH
jgi:hypothetical protein